MNKLQIVTNNLTPAVVKFNYDEIEAHLTEMLAKYENLVFTEETATECRKTIAELRKAQRSLDDFRKKTKKELTKSVTDFENDCKKLYKKFDEVIDPLSEQASIFEEARKAEKQEKVQKVINELINEQGLNEKYAAELVVEPEFLNKTKSMKSIKEELSASAESLGALQDKEEAQIELIISKVELASAKHNVNLSANAYIDLLEYEDIDEVVEKITIDASEMAKPKPEPKPAPAPKSAPKPNAEVFIATYEVEGTDEQLDALEKYIDQNFTTWNLLDD